MESVLALVLASVLVLAHELALALVLTLARELVMALVQESAWASVRCWFGSHLGSWFLGHWFRHWFGSLGSGDGVGLIIIVSVSISTESWFSESALVMASFSNTDWS